MAINIAVANRQAAQLAQLAAQLAEAKSSLGVYQAALSGHWQAAEMNHINKAIEQVSAQINGAAQSLYALSDDVKSVAAAIKREEDAAAADAQKQAMIEEAQTALTAAQEEADGLKKKLLDTIRLFGKMPGAAAIIAKAQALFDEAALQVKTLQEALDALLR